MRANLIRNSVMQIGCALVAVFGSAQLASASNFLSSSPGTPLAGPDNLVQYTISMVSNSGDTIDGFTFTSVTPVAGLGAHQVWVPQSNSPTSTRQSHLDGEPALWSDTWLPYDTYFFPTNANSLKTPGELVETKTGTGAVLPSAGFGPPPTGYGAISSPLPPGVSLPVAYAYILSSGMQGSSVPLMQLVLRAQDSVLVSTQILTTRGNTQDAALIVGIPEPSTVVLVSVTILGAFGLIRRR